MRHVETTLAGMVSTNLGDVVIMKGKLQACLALGLELCLPRVFGVWDTYAVGCQEAEVRTSTKPGVESWPINLGRESTRQLLPKPQFASGRGLGRKVTLKPHFAKLQVVGVFSSKKESPSKPRRNPHAPAKKPPCIEPLMKEQSRPYPVHFWKKGPEPEVTWGDARYGGDSSAVAEQLQDLRRLPGFGHKLPSTTKTISFKGHL